MVIDGWCKKCRQSFNAHWTVYPVFDRPNICPYCKASDVIITDDEIEEKEDLDYEEEI